MKLLMLKNMQTWSRQILIAVSTAIFFVSAAHGAGNASKSGTAPTISTKNYDYYLTGNVNDQVLTAPTSRMTVLMGGGLDVDQAFQDMIAKARGSATTKVDIVVIRASGEDGYNPYLSQMQGVDSVETLVIKNTQGANDSKVKSIVAGADVLFIAGGDQWTYISQWNETSIETTVKALSNKNVPIGGTSAGLAVLGAVDYSAQYGTVTSAEALADPYNRRLTLHNTFLETVPLLGNTIVDAHLVSRDRMGRLVTFLARMIKDGIPWNSARAIGVDEGTAVVIDGDKAVVRSNGGGTGAAYFLRLPYDATKSFVVKSRTPLDVRSVQVDKLTQSPDAWFDLANGIRSGGTGYSLDVINGVLYGPGNNPY